MKTIMIWLLVSIGGGPYSGRPHVVVERFADVQECQRVAVVLSDAVDYPSKSVLKCVQATVVEAK